MKVLFVCSGNKGLNPIIKNQGDSLIAKGISLDYFLIKGKGFSGYLRNIKILNNYLKENKYDIIHSHYSLTAFVASMAFAKPLVVSLMGSDVKKGNIYRIVIKFFAFLFSWKEIIVKSEDMKQSLGIKKTKVIPNGVNLDRFKELSQEECIEILGWNKNKKHILFPSNPQRLEKNYKLLEESVRGMNADIHYFVNVPNEKTPYWYNAANVVVMTSLWEGSPNAIKEAMSCNCPIVCTDVGDVKWLFGKTEGCFISKWDREDLKSKIVEALAFDGRTKGRFRILALNLSSNQVAKTIISIYKDIIS